MRVEHIGDATLYLADYRDVELPTDLDAVFTDPPYGTTACDWDSEPADMAAFWKKITPAIKENAAVVVFGAGTFFVDVVNSNRKWFRYDLVYEKALAVGHLDVNRRPLRAHELMAVFYRSQPEYHPQKFQGSPYRNNGFKHDRTTVYGRQKIVLKSCSPDGMRYPRSIIRCGGTGGKSFHPTAKPVELMEWLTRTYTGAGRTVLDPFMGSGSTGVAVLKNGRRFIGVEKEEKYFDIACHRIEEKVKRPKQFSLISEAEPAPRKTVAVQCVL